MSHEIDMSNGRANMAYVGEKPWHGLGASINPDASIRGMARGCRTQLADQERAGDVRAGR
jgi:hypothetical protein